MGAIGRTLKRKPLPQPNTFLGGTGVSFPTAASLVGRYRDDIANATTKAVSLKRFTASGPDNEISFYKRGAYRLYALNAFFGSVVNYYYDTDGKIVWSNQGVFRSCNLYRFWIPNNKLWQAPSGYFTLNAVKTRGYLYLPHWTGEGNNQNHIWNSGSSTDQLDVLYAPKLTRLTLQPTSRNSFNNQTAIRRVVWPRLKWMSAQNSSRIFGNVNSSCIFYLAKELSYYVKGNENIHVTYWRGLGCEIRWVENELKPNAVNDLAAVNTVPGSVEITFTPPAINENTIDGYEVWIAKVNPSGEERFQLYVPTEEALASGHIISGLDQGEAYTVKLKTFDQYYNVSQFSNEVAITTSMVGLLQGSIIGQATVQTL